MKISFDQLEAKFLSLKDIGELNRKIKALGHTLILRGFIKCDKCLSTTPLDMFVEENYKVCKCELTKTTK